MILQVSLCSSGNVAAEIYSGISIKCTHYKVDTCIRRTVWWETDCFALRPSYLRKSLYKADISLKRTLFCTSDVRFIEIPLYLCMFTITKKILSEIYNALLPHISCFRIYAVICLESFWLKRCNVFPNVEFPMKLY